MMCIFCANSWESMKTMFQKFYESVAYFSFLKVELVELNLFEI
jgi:hypothetical protein